MKIKAILIGELPPELGPGGTRLIVRLENGAFVGILLDDIRDHFELAERLQVLIADVERATHIKPERLN